MASNLFELAPEVQALLSLAPSSIDVRKNVYYGGLWEIVRVVDNDSIRSTRHHYILWNQELEFWAEAIASLMKD